MNAQDSLVNQLNNALSNPQDGPHAVELESPESRRKFILRFKAVEGIGCLLDELKVETNSTGNAKDDVLQKRAKHLGDRVQYLLEPLALLELDAELDTAQLRSAPPTRTEAETRYFELSIQTDEMTLKRYAKSPKNVRQEIPMEVTKETLHRLIKDLEAA